ncbi:MAG: ferritin-like domain-containing protein, partial [Chloroflexi bacterium]|nr:ferritin-like domain-containing protein [Chloroflexota bacterium]
RPTFDTSQPVWNPANTTQLANLADALENTGTGAYLYAIQNNSPFAANANAAQAAAAIDLVEGRHAGFLNALTNRPLLTDPNPNIMPLDSQPPITSYLGVTSQSQEVAQPPSEVGMRAAPFLVNLNLNGGPGLPGDNLAGATIPDILNYALLLEYLERDWYVKNVGQLLGV